MKKIWLLSLFLLGSFCLTWCNGDLNGAEKQVDTSLEIVNLSWNQQEEISENTEKALVLVFSPTGHTKKIASFISEITDADLTEILPMIPYTEEDLNYNVKDSRANNEQNDSQVRPEIATEISLEGYDRIYLGYPIWWWTNPKIILTLIEKYDFSGKEIVLFCTSWSSGIGTSESALKGKGLKIIGSKRFAQGATKEEVQEWIKNL